MESKRPANRWTHVFGVGLVAFSGLLAVAFSVFEGETQTDRASAAAPANALIRVPDLAFDGTPEPLPTPTPAPTPTPLPPRTSLEGLRVWSDGDSTSYFMTVAFLQIAAAQGGVPVRAADYKISSGLLNTAFFDWPGYIASEMALYDPDVAVFMVGANDAMQIRSYPDYAARVGAVMDEMYRPGRIVVWMGQPNMRPDPSQGYNPALAQAIPPVNEVFQSEAAKRSWVRYVDTWALTSYSEGSYADVLPDENGVPQVLRASDGIHFTPAGGRRLALGALAAVLRWYEPPARNNRHTLGQTTTSSPRSHRQGGAMSGEHGTLRLSRKVAIHSHPHPPRRSPTDPSPLSPQSFALSTPASDAVAQPDDYPPVRNGFVTTTPP